MWVYVREVWDFLCHQPATHGSAVYHSCCHPLAVTLTEILVEQLFYKQLEELLLHSSLIQPLLPSELHTKLLLEVIRIVLGVDL